MSLKVCPFCRSEAEIMELWGAVDLPTARIQCSECPASMEMTMLWNAPEKMKAEMVALRVAVTVAWNNRPYEKRLEDIKTRQTHNSRTAWD